MEEKRKSDHIDLARQSQTHSKNEIDGLYYEPMLSAHPKEEATFPTKFLGTTLNFPVWISSMTGGTDKARLINHNLALVAREFKIGIGLGSCRTLLNSLDRHNDFHLRPILGPDHLFFSNIGIAQLEELISTHTVDKLHTLVTEHLKATGLIIHVNPLQEWFQPEGDRFKVSPIETIQKFLVDKKYPVIVKEVGQGMGPLSLKALLNENIDAIELSGFGGTNFSALEIMRSNHKNFIEKSSANDLAYVGHTAQEMIDWINILALENPKIKEKEIIISGGIKNVIHGHALREKCKLNSVMGFAMRFLEHAENIDNLYKFVELEMQTLVLTKNIMQKCEAGNGTH